MTLTQLAQVSALIGTVLPLLIAVVQRQHWSERTRSLVALGACFVASGVAAVAAGDLTLTNYGTSLGVVFVAARASYAGLWKPTGVAGAVEDATSPAQTAQEPAQGDGAATEGNDPAGPPEAVTEPPTEPELIPLAETPTTANPVIYATPN